MANALLLAGGGIFVALYSFVHVELQGRAERWAQVHYKEDKRDRGRP
jgi:hypothetical protein